MVSFKGFILSFPTEQQQVLHTWSPGLVLVPFLPHEELARRPSPPEPLQTPSWKSLLISDRHRKSLNPVSRAIWANVLSKRGPAPSSPFLVFFMKTKLYIEDLRSPLLPHFFGDPQSSSRYKGMEMELYQRARGPGEKVFGASHEVEA